MTNELFPLLGRLTLTLSDSEGKVKTHLDIPNLIVQVGKNFMANAIFTASSTPFSNIAIGTGATAPAIGDTLLTIENARTPFASASATANVVTMTANFAGGVGTGALQEAGIFNSATTNAGVMLSHVTYGTITKGATDTLLVTWTVTAG